MFLEHLAMYNGADMYKYNTLYTHKLNQHVLTPEAYLFLCHEINIRMPVINSANILFYAFTAQRIFVERALLLRAHSSADGLITSLAASL